MVGVVAGEVVDPGAGSTDGPSSAAAGADDSASDEDPAGASAGWVPVGLALLAVGYLGYRLIIRRRSSSEA